MNAIGREEELTRALLEAIGHESDVSQRHLARHLGVALGLANSYLKRCIRKGYVKVQHAPANRYLYYLTPKGFTEKARLTGQYLQVSFDFYRRAATSCDRALRVCDAQGWRRLLLAGVSELAEIASVRAVERGLNVVGTFDPDTDRTQFLGRPVYREARAAPRHDACLLTDVTNAQAGHDRLVAAFGGQPVLVPDILPVAEGR
ncbi:MAG: hypothetical protein B7Z66_08565 [Chromatiales bacterium 21-64-14]|nr:MAG: hypothetical protein B7Z66_08565 [Chromatiales bacterium 21-64-14]HQU15389.1 winged helix-turn-helix transcriptional regulator [Gammaproteobacteria bacterium]